MLSVANVFLLENIPSDFNPVAKPFLIEYVADVILNCSNTYIQFRRYLLVAEST